jgi:hydroxypyruvate isomerase
MNQSIPRRTAIKSLATGAAAVAATQAITSQASAAHHGSKLKGNINHSVCKWCEAVKGMGLNAVDLIAIEDFPTLQKHGLSCSLVTGVPGGIKKGLNREENHETLIAWFEEVCPQISAAGYKQVVCFSGNRDGMSDIQGLANCTKGLNQIVPIAEKHGVTVVMELLNSKVNHADYMADLSSWGVALCDTVGSDAFKLLYDIYHMQIMEGDVIATIRKNHKYYSHYHTGGVPGRAEIDTTQELYYPAIMEAILETGFDGYVAQEFIPAGPNPLASLEAAVQICDV